jgi:hypothetical protein
MGGIIRWRFRAARRARSPATIFDQEFCEHVIETGKIEDGRVVRQFFQRAGQPLMQEWLMEPTIGVASPGREGGPQLQCLSRNLSRACISL